MSHASQTATTLTSLDPVLNLPLDPSLALVFHTCNRDLSLVTRHRITKTGKGHSLDAGRPLSREDEQQILRLLDRDTRPSGTAGWLPPNLLAEKGDAVMWFEPGSVRTLLIGGDDGVSTVSVHTPNLVLALNGKQTLHVYAVATSERPGPDTPVFHAPLGNIYADGTVCYGNAVLPTKKGREAISEWNRMFFCASAFTHANHPNWLAGKPGRQADKWWRDHASKPAGTRPFPAKYLSPMDGATLAQVWSP